MLVASRHLRRKKVTLNLLARSRLTTRVRGAFARAVRSSAERPAYKARTLLQLFEPQEDLAGKGSVS